MKIDSPHFRQMFTPELQRLVGLFRANDFELRIAGGAVRDLLTGKTPDDIDFATTATPTEMKALFEREGIRMIHSKGEAHGTITCRINDRENFEVTTLRIDVATDGRHADVQFTKNWQLDALRRDLTINSMFLGLDGTIYDYFDGRGDLEARRVRFVGSATQRITEDYLRILRYFRFFGRIVEDGTDHLPENLAAIRDNVAGLGGISGERIFGELKKILCGRHVAAILAVMLECGMAPFVGLPAACDLEEFTKRARLCATLNLKPSPVTLLSALLRSDEHVYRLNERLRMSKVELQLMLFLLRHRDRPSCHDDADILRHCQDLLCDTVATETRATDYICELLTYWGESEALERFRAWKLPKFPVNGIVLLQAGVPKGPALARALQHLRQEWKKSDYTYTQEDLLKLVAEQQ